MSTAKTQFNKIQHKNVIPCSLQNGLMELLMLWKDVQDIFGHENIIHIHMLRKKTLKVYTPKCYKSL